MLGGGSKWESMTEVRVRFSLGVHRLHELSKQRLLPTHDRLSNLHLSRVTRAH